MAACQADGKNVFLPDKNNRTQIYWHRKHTTPNLQSVINSNYDYLFIFVVQLVEICRFTRYNDKLEQ